MIYDSIATATDAKRYSPLRRKSEDRVSMNDDRKSENKSVRFA